MNCNFVSLGEFERRHGVNKGTVSKRAREMGFDTAKGLSPDAYEAMKQEFSVSQPQQPAAVATLPTITTGNHRGELALPQQPAAIDLGAYRGENAALSSFEPEDIERFLSACDGFLEAVDADYQHQQSLTQRKAAAAQQVAAKVEQVKQASMIYQLRSEQLALHNATLDQALQRDMATLGKPQQPAARSQP